LVNTLILVDSFLYMVLAIQLEFDHTLCLCCLVMLMFTLKILNSEQVFVGFSNIGIASALFLFVVAEGLKETQIFSKEAKWLLLKMDTENKVNLTLLPIVILVSAITPNQILLIILLPMLEELYNIKGLKLQKTLMPLSYCIILGS